MALALRLLLLVTLVCAGCCPAHAPDAHAAKPAPSATPSAASKEDIAPEAATGYRQLAPVRAREHMVASANPHASRAGLALLRAGGSAVDAAIAMALVLTLVEPQSSGIGGGAFMLHYQASARAIAAYDGRETAPKAASGDMFLRDGKPRDFFDAVVGGMSVGVPGELRMLELAHKRHGKLPWKQLFEPAIALCERGFSISPRLFALIDGAPRLRDMSAARRYFYLPSGEPKPVGTLLANPELAAVLRAVADGGADAFYTGAIAADIVSAARGAERNPGRLSVEDLRSYRAIERQPVCLPYRTYRLCGFPPPTSGGITTLQIMGLLQRFELSALAPDAADVAHLFAEAGRLAFADRDRYIADPDFVDVPVKGLLDPSYLAARSQLIDGARSLGRAPAGTPAGHTSDHAVGSSADLPSTSHLVVVDRDGNVVSMTASIESAFGSHVMVRGFLLNNELTDFSFVAEVDGRDVANRVEPGKRPRSSMAPVIVLDPAANGFVLAAGSPGGSRIISYVARVLLAMLDHGLDPQAAINLPNVSNRNGATEIELDGDDPAWRSWAERTRVELEARGHEVTLGELNSGLSAIRRTPEGYVGGVDPRREGVALGD